MTGNMGRRLPIAGRAGGGGGLRILILVVGVVCLFVALRPIGSYS